MPCCRVCTLTERLYLSQVVVQLGVQYRWIILPAMWSIGQDRLSEYPGEAERKDGRGLEEYAGSNVSQP